MKKIIPLLIFIFIFTTSCAKTSLLETYTATITRTDNTNISLKVEIAQTSEERARGFMERENIPEGTGMIFVFDRDQMLSFWMKDTPSPLSIAYIDSKGIIKEIHDMKPLSLAPVASSVSCRYALEVPQKWFTNNNINVGDAVELPR